MIFMADLAPISGGALLAGGLSPCPEAVPGSYQVNPKRTFRGVTVKKIRRTPT
jgi:hypothetical protein